MRFRSALCVIALLTTLLANVATAQQPSQRFEGAIRHTQPDSQAIDLSLDRAIALGLQYNVGLLVAGKLSDQARAARLEQLSRLLPTVDGSLRASQQKSNLEAFGISGPTVPRSVEVSNYDARVSASAPLIDLHALSTMRAATASASATEWDARDAREAVVLAVATAYLQTVSAEAALTAAQADLTTAQSLYDLARDRERSGVSPEIDTLRAQVEMQTQQQAVTEVRTAFDKQRIALLRIVGLPLTQAVALSSRMPYKETPLLGVEEALARALANRGDYKAADAQVQAAELTRHAAVVQRVPALSFTGDYGALGTEPSNAFSTWSFAGVLRMPIFEGGRIRAEVAGASAVLDQRKAERDDLRIAIEQQIANALLDVRSAGEQVQVASATIDLARRALTQAQDRFQAGVTNNIEVVQAQEALVNANRQYVAALQAHNLAKLTLARTMGAVEQTWKDVLAP